MSQVLEKYHVFKDDTYLNLMPQLRSAGLVPLSVAGLMQERLEAIVREDEKVKDFFSSNFDTGDGVAYSSGKVKVILDAQPLRDLDSDIDTGISYLYTSHLGAFFDELLTLDQYPDYEGALLLTPEQYASCEGQEFFRKDLEKAGVNRRLSKKEAKQHPVWLALARDKNLLSEYVDFIFKEVEQKCGSTEAMGVWLASEQEQPTLRAWTVDGLLYRSWSCANGGGDLYGNYGLARLVGVRAEGAAQKEGLDEIVEGRTSF